MGRSWGRSVTERSWSSSPASRRSGRAERCAARRRGSADHRHSRSRRPDERTARWSRSRGSPRRRLRRRIRSLIDRNIVGITAIFDWYAAGYHWDAWLAVECEGGPIAPVVKALGELDEVVSVYTVFGPVDLVVQVMCTDREALLGFLSGTLTQVAGIRKADVMLSLDTVKYFHQFAWVPVAPAAAEVPESGRRAERAGLVHHRGGRAQRPNVQPRDRPRARNRRWHRACPLCVGSRTPGCCESAPRFIRLRSGMIHAPGVRWASRCRVRTPRPWRPSSRRSPEIVTISITAGRYELFCYVLARSRSRLIEIVVGADQAVEGRPVVGDLGGDRRRQAHQPLGAVVVREPCGSRPPLGGVAHATITLSPVAFP